MSAPPVKWQHAVASLLGGRHTDFRLSRLNGSVSEGIGRFNGQAESFPAGGSRLLSFLPLQIDSECADAALVGRYSFSREHAANVKPAPPRTPTGCDVTIIHGGTPENGFISYRYQGYDESLLMHVLGFGSTTFRAAAGGATGLAEDIRLAKAIRRRIPPRGSAVHSPAQSLLDRFSWNQRWLYASQGPDYFENSCRRLRAAKLCPGIPEFRGYGPLVWGLSASDGPGPATKTIENAD